jgi:hypothetical protein
VDSPHFGDLPMIRIADAAHVVPLAIRSPALLSQRKSRDADAVQSLHPAIDGHDGVCPITSNASSNRRTFGQEDDFILRGVEVG